MTGDSGVELKGLEVFIFLQLLLKFLLLSELGADEVRDKIETWLLGIHGEIIFFEKCYVIQIRAATRPEGLLVWSIYPGNWID